MRLVWGRLWAVVAQHLVAAACSRDVDVALQAAGHLADLSRLLLEQRDLPHFSHQVCCLLFLRLSQRLSVLMYLLCS